MKRLSSICVFVWSMGFLGMTPGFAVEPDLPESVSEVREVYTPPSSISVPPVAQFKNVEGTLKEIQGNVYVVEGESSEQPIRVEIGQDTAFPNGEKKLGQVIHALVFSRNGYALIVR